MANALCSNAMNSVRSWLGMSDRLGVGYVDAGTSALGQRQGAFVMAAELLPITPRAPCRHPRDLELVEGPGIPVLLQYQGTIEQGFDLGQTGEHGRLML